MPDERDIEEAGGASAPDEKRDVELSVFTWILDLVQADEFAFVAYLVLFIGASMTMFMPFLQSFSESVVPPVTHRMVVQQWPAIAAGVCAMGDLNGCFRADVDLPQFNPDQFTADPPPWNRFRGSA